METTRQRKDRIDKELKKVFLINLKILKTEILERFVFKNNERLDEMK